MNTNFFTSEQGFQKPLIDKSNNIGTNRDFTTSLKKDEFRTSSTSKGYSQNDVKESEQNKKFNDIMDSLKSKENAKSENEVSSHTQETTENKDLRAQIMIQNSKLEAFSTQQSAVSSNTVNIEAIIADTDELPIDLLNLAEINAEIQKLIATQTQSTDTESQIIVSAKNVTEDKMTNILSIISALLSDTKAGKESKVNNEELSLISIIEQVKTALESKDIPEITTGLSPKQITQLQDDIQKYLNNDLNEKDLKELESLIAQFVTLTPPSDRKPSKDVGQTVLQIIPEKVLAPTPKENLTQERFETRYDARYDNTDKSIQPDIKSNNKGEFKEILKDASISTNTAPSNDNAKSAGQTFLQAPKLEQSIGQMLNSQSQSTPLLSATQSTQTTLQNSLTNVITQSQSAGTAHQATQLVSATIQKAVKAGEDTNIKLKLDPPELGRVEVKMSIDKDNNTRVILTVEKPETYLLLKQDADILQRALNDTGLNADGNLSFELADGENNFGGNNHGNGGNQTGNGSNNNDEDLIETTMDWQVNPETGRMHYNVLV